MRLFRLIAILAAVCWSAAAGANNLPAGGAWHGFTAVHDDGAGGSHNVYYSKDAQDACEKSADYAGGVVSTADPKPRFDTTHGYWIDCEYHHFLEAGGVRHTPLFWDCPPGVNVACEKPQGPTCPKVANPVALSSGAKFEEVLDYSSGGPNALEFRRYYQSVLSSQPGSMGPGWTHSYDRYLAADNASSPTTFYAFRPDGWRFEFAKSGSAWLSASGSSDQTARLVETTAGSIYEVVDGADRTDRFQNVSGTYRLTQSRWRNGYQQDMAYDTGGRLATVTDSYGRTLTFAWSNSKPVSVTAPDGYLIKFTYALSAEGLPSMLSKVLKQSSAGISPEVTEYLHELTDQPHLLTGVVDGNGNRFSTFDYDEFGRGILSEHAGGAGRYEIEYDDVNNTRTVTNPLGKETVYHFTKRQGVFKLDTIDGVASANCPAATSAQTYDSNGFVSSRVDWNGNLTTYVRDARGLETSRTEAVGEPEERTITTTWHWTFRVPTQIVMPGRTIDLTYDSQGRLTQRTETDTTSHSVPYSTNGQARTWIYSWNTDGELISVDGPRTDVTDLTMLTYDGVGNLISVANALSQEIVITSSNARNQPLSITDQNGIVTDLTYDTHGRLIKRTVHTGGRDEVMEMAFDAAGQVIAVTSPDGMRIEYEYDGAHRLTTIKNTLGERIELVLNAMGNRTQMQIKSTTGTILKTQSAIHDELGRLLQSVGASSQTTSFQYDDNGNTVEVTDPRGAVTAQAFDALDRLVQSTDALTGVTEYQYDAQGNLISVDDAKNQITNYVYNGFGDVIQLTSPETGVTVYEVDKAGNRTKETDARGVVTNYSYDALNRLTVTTYPASTGENVAFTYDDTTGGNKGVGRLTGVTDEQGTASYVYDGQGRLAQETRVIGAVSYTTSYGYDAAGNLQTITYPTSRTVTYQRDTLGRVNAVLSQANGSAPPALIAGNISYLPFGPIQSLTFGNGVVATYEYDQDYRLTGITSSKGTTGVQDLTLSHDGADNITAITDALDTARNQTFEYDLLGRLTDAAGAYGTEEYAYDAVGNRLTRTLVQGTTTNVTYTYASGSNQLQSASNGSTTRSFTYDDVGNTDSDSVSGGASFTYAYNNANRLKQSQEGGGLTFNYGYDAFGERVIKQAVGQAGTHFRYDPMGHLIHESDDTGNPIRSYIYLGDLPIAQIEPGAAGTPTDIIMDDTDTGAAATGTWSSSSAGTGYEGTGHRTHAAPDLTALGGTVIDNGTAGFTAFGQWDSYTSALGFVGSDYLKRDHANAPAITLTHDNTDAGFSTVGSWSTGNIGSGFIGANYRYRDPNGISPAAEIVDDGDAGFSAVGNWSGALSDSGAQNGDYIRHTETPSANAIIVDNSDAAFTAVSGEGWVTMTNQASTRYGANYLAHIPNGLSTSGAVIDNTSADFSATGSWTTTNSGSGFKGTNFTYYWQTSLPASAVIVDNSDAGAVATGTWSTNTSWANRVGADVRYHSSSTTTTDKFTWTPTVPSNQNYRVYARWAAGSSTSSNAKFTVYHAGGSTLVTVSQDINRGTYIYLGTFTMEPSQSHRVELSGQGNGNTIADAIAIVPASEPEDKATWTLPVTTSGQYRVVAWWKEQDDWPSAAVYRVYHAGGSTDVTVDQTNNGGRWISLGTFQLDPGQNHRVEISSLHVGRSATADAIGIDPTSATGNTATWQPTLAVSDSYKVFARWPENNALSYASNAQFTVHHAGGTTVVSKDLRNTGGVWRLLGTFQMDPGQGHKVVLSDVANGTLTADVVAFDAATLAGDKAVWTLPVSTADQYFVYARWVLPSNYAPTITFTVYHDGGSTVVNKIQSSGFNSWQSLGAFNLTPGQNHRVELSGFANGTVSADAVAIESATSSPGNQAIWTLPLTVPDKYDVFARFGTNDSGTSNAKYVVTHAGGTDTVTVNQNVNEGFWIKLDTYDLAPGAGHKVTLSDRTNGVVQADAIRLVSAEGVERIARWQGTVTNAGTYQVWARWPAAPTHTFAASYDIIAPSGTETALVNQRIEGGRWHLLKTITLAANDNWSVELSDQSAGEVVADAVAITSPLTLTDRFDWSPTLPSAGDYAVYAKWQAADDRATDATYEITHSGGVAEVTVDQRHNGGAWRYLGTWSFDPSQSPKVSLLASLNGTVNADAVRFVSGDAIGGDIAYSHTDQIGTIQKLTDASGNLVWDRVARPFGETVSINAASGVDQKLRFPGQYGDETGLAYNYLRDYDPTLGRYAQIDPIGLAGGINPYRYTAANPLKYTDRMGLVPGPGTGSSGAVCVCSNILVKEMDIEGDGEDKDWGHHWIEIGEIGTDGQWHPDDSYGWWPNWNPDDGFDSSGSAGDAIGGTGGIINGGGDEDPHQGDGPAEGVDRAYNPKIRKPGDAGCDEACEEAAKCLKDFAQSYGENYGAEWNYRFDLDLLGDMSCHSFVERALAECELSRELR
jgi:RHS repeat-associated protein